MKIKIAAMCLIIALVLNAQAGWLISNKTLAKGNWYFGTNTHQPASPAFHFENGVITYWANGKVFGTYEFIDSDHLRFKQTKEDTETITINDDDGNDKDFEMPTVKLVDLVVFVEFQTDDQMIWYRIAGDKKFRWYSFSRFKK